MECGHRIEPIPALTLHDSRTLEYDLLGDPAGTPVIVLHGTPGSSRQLAHARVIAARCPTAHVHIVDGGGHLLLDAIDRILASVTGSG